MARKITPAKPRLWWEPSGDDSYYHMTESEWFTSTDLQQMLRFLRGKATDRKLRLFACACCRRVWHLLDDERSRSAVEVAERFADGNANREELAAARKSAETFDSRETSDLLGDDCPYEEYWGRPRNSGNAIPNRTPVLHQKVLETGAASAAWFLAEKSAPYAAMSTPGIAAEQEAHAEAGPNHTVAAYHALRHIAREGQASILRDIIGNPFCPVPPKKGKKQWVQQMSSWLTPTVTTLAQSIYEERTFDRLPILADALEESGCTSDDILNHCRQSGVHVRGCWALDMVLGKT